MPRFTNKVPKDPRGPSFIIRRTPPSAPLIAIVTSQDLIGCYTHFHHGRTIPCERPKCEGCDDNLPYRWHAYMTAWEEDESLHFLFEVTAQAAERFTEFRDANTTLRGCLFRAHRLKSRPNGRVLLRMKPADLTKIILPEPPHLENVLSILWGLPSDTFTKAGLDPERKSPSLRFDPKSGQKRDAG